jgi:hypothetical protein
MQAQLPYDHCYDVLYADINLTIIHRRHDGLYTAVNTITMRSLSRWPLCTFKRKYHTINVNVNFMQR